MHVHGPQPKSKASLSTVSDVVDDIVCRILFVIIVFLFLLVCECVVREM
jgi:hypothetical protein